MNKKRILALAGAAAPLLLFSLCSGAGRPAPSYFSTDTPYSAAAAADDHAARGLETVFIEHLGRHGSRYFTSDKRLRKMLAALEYAGSLHELSPKGAALEAAVKEFLGISDFENVTPLAAVQQKGIADRMRGNNKELFSQLGPGKKILTLSTFKKRTQDTRDALLAELAAVTGADPAAVFVSEVSTACQPLRFFECDQKYRAYKKAGAWRSAPEFKALAPKTAAVSREVLSRLFTGNFLARLGGPADKGGSFSSPSEMAVCLYEIAAMETDLGKDIYGFRRLFGARQLEWFEYLNDYNDFYEKGPGYPGNTVTFGMARELLGEFITSAQRAIDSPAGSPAAELRFAHAETLLPLAALMGLEGASEQKAEYPFTRARWKAADVSPMSGNIQWILYRSKAGNGYKLRILLNERPVKIAGGPRADGYYYDWPAVKKFYEDRLARL